MIRALFLAVFLAMPSVAECSPWRGAGVIIGRAGERLCAKHHQQLTTTTVYGPADGVCVLLQPNKRTAKVRAASPNAFPLGVTRQKTPLYSRAAEVSYCARCEADVIAAARK